jgi:hypothetical protein
LKTKTTTFMHGMFEELPLNRAWNGKKTFEAKRASSTLWFQYFHGEKAIELKETHSPRTYVNELVYHRKWRKVKRYKIFMCLVPNQEWKQHHWIVQWRRKCLISNRAYLPSEVRLWPWLTVLLARPLVYMDFEFHYPQLPGAKWLLGL